MTASHVDVAALRQRLDLCPPGWKGWRQFEDVARDILCYLHVPPLERPRPQARSLSGLDRRDAIFPDRVTDPAAPWGLLRMDNEAKLILVEFKNYDKEEIGKDDVDQTRNYMKRSWGRLAIVCCNKPPSDAACRRRNNVYTEEAKSIVFLTSADLHEMLDMKERGDDPALFVLDAVDELLMQHE